MKTPVLLVGWVPRIVAVVARSLHSHGIPVEIADMTEERPVRSRAIRHFTRLPNPDLDPDYFCQKLVDLIKARCYSMLIPTNDQALTVMARHYQDINSLLHVACPPPHIVDRVLNKASALEAAKEAGLQVPRNSIVSNTDELSALINEMPFPWVLKPSAKESHVEEFKSCTLAGIEELKTRFPKPRKFNPPILVQDFCPGMGLGIEVLLHNGECLAAFQHRRLKELPHTGGYAVMAVAEAPDRTLLNSSLALLRALQWEGIAMVEFRVNPVNNRAVFMEVNGRYWGSISLPVAAGVDFPLYHWQFVHGEAVQVPNTYQVGLKWRWTTGYLVRLHRLLKETSRVPASQRVLRQELLDIFSDFSSSVDPLFVGRDLLASLSELAGTTKDLLLQDLKAISNRKPFRN